MSETISSPPAVRPGIEGGYQLIAARSLARLWWAYRKQQLRFADVRAYLGCQELLARRCTMRRGRVPRFTTLELHAVTGLSVRRLGPTLRRLERAGLLTWSENAIRFPSAPQARSGVTSEDFEAFLALIPNNRRLVPVPRRMLRLLASAARPALLATVLGHLLRCLYSRQGTCSGRGRCKASWIADTFGVAQSRVKAARRELIDQGWLVRLEAGQWALNRWGLLVEINLAWVPGAAPGAAGPRPPRTAGDSEMRPPGGDFGPETSPPVTNKDLPCGSKDQELGRTEPAGVYTGRAHLPKPSLNDIRPEDLECFSRTEALYWQAVRRKVICHTEGNVLNWLGAAVRARSVAGDPVRIFLGIVKGRLWGHITQAQEERARRALARYREENPKRFREFGSEAREPVTVRTDERVRRLASYCLVRSAGSWSAAEAASSLRTARYEGDTSLSQATTSSYT